ncbi:MAG TPA: hypothetical protein VJ083_07310, partial [Sedimentibacter sp.]|nr:hypothetical protein [Sedimentibacter sp.]
MAKIPTFNPLSGEARSPLIAGLTEVANKISDALNMQSEEFENVILSEVFITDSDRYRIYEVDMGKKLWLSEPNPIIRKNGSIINSAVDNFTVDLIGGSIAFEPTNRLLETDILTATFTSVKAESKKLYDIQQTLIEIQTKLAKDKGYYESPTELRVAYPIATNGDFAVVGTTDTMWVWDNDTTDWKDTHKITDLTNYYDKSVIDNLLSQKEPTLNAKGTDTVDDNFYYGGRKQWIDLFAKVRNTILTGIDLTAQGKVEEIDNVIIALGKLQSQINSSNIAVEDLSNGKVDKIDGKGLSTNDLTNELKTKYDNYNTTKEPTITTKKTAFNKNFGTGENDVMRGNKTFTASDVGAYGKSETYSKTELANSIVYTLNYSKNGNVHQLTGTGLPTSGYYTARFKANNGFVSGDTFAINGETYTAVTANLEPLDTDFFKGGATVPVEVDVASKRLNFKLGGTGGINQTLPPQIRNFKAEAGNSKVDLSWNIPSDTTDYAGLLFVRKVGSAPTGVNDGTKVVIDRYATSYIDTGLANDTTYYYRAFPFNSKKQYQTELTGAVVSGMPKAGILASSFPVGTLVRTQINGVNDNAIVTNQEIPENSPLYDSSCNGTWLLTKDMYINHQWSSNNVNKYT